MIRLNDIYKAFEGLVGWEQDIMPNADIAALTESESGLYYQAAHPLVTLNNVRAIMPETKTEDFPEWNATTQYRAGDFVRFNGSLYSANSQTLGTIPDRSSVWRKTSIIEEFLRKVTRQGISQVVTTFLQQKQLNQETRNLLEHRTFFDGAGRINATLKNTHKLVGFEIIPVRSMGVTAKIERIGFQFAGGEADFKLYLFHSSRVAPVQVFNVRTKGNGSFQWLDLNAYLPYISDGNNAGGSWFLCYDQDELGSTEAINVSKDWSREPCGTCNIGSVEAWRELTKYLQVSPFMVKAPTTFDEFPEMWDIAETIYTNTNNYGLNVEISVGCDLTDFIIEQRQIFAPVLQKQVAANILRTLAMNPDVRVNRNQSNASRMDILYELDGNTQGRATGIGEELKQAYKALSIDTQGLDRICLSCNNHGVKYRTI